MLNSACGSWETHLESYLLGDPDSFAPLYKAAKAPLLRYLSRRAPFMPGDIREEVYDQIFVRLLENPPSYDRANCSLRSLMYGLARNALKQVRATYVAAGQKTRISGDESEFATQYFNATSDDLTSGVEESDDSVLEQAPSHRWTSNQRLAAVEANELFSRMPHDQARAAWLVLGLELSNVDAAGLIGVSRFAVARLIGRARSAVALDSDDLLKHSEAAVSLAA
jgi:DNA-directed RNA polymerase specialized sigma24 family protein